MRNKRRRERYHENKRVSSALHALTREADTDTASGSAEEAICVLRHALSSPSGRRRIPILAELVEQEVARRTEQLTGALQAVCSKFPAQSSGRKHVVNTVARATSTKTAAAIVGTTRKYVTSCATRVGCEGVTDGIEVSSSHGRRGVQYTHIGPLEGRFILMFVFSEASAKSGQKPRKKGITLYTEQPLWRFYVKYKIEFLYLCLLEAREDTQYSLPIPDTVSEHEANCRTALWMSEQPDFDLSESLAMRQEEFRQERLRNGVVGYTSSHHGQSTEGIPCTPPKQGRQATKNVRENFDPSTWSLVPRSYKTLMTFLSMVSSANSLSLGFTTDIALPTKWHGIKVIPTTDPKHCPICELGVQQRQRLEALRAKHDGTTETYRDLEAVAEMTKLEQKVHRFEVHRRAIAIAAAYWKEIERVTMAVPNRFAVTMDFVSWFALNGEKVRDLVLVILSYKFITTVHCINWGNTAGCDTYFVADALKHVFLRSTLFKGATDVDLCSDHGSCFDNPRTFYTMSKLRLLIRERGDGFLALEPHTAFKTEYHGAGRADGAGAAAKGNYNRWSLETGMSGSGPQFVRMLNDGYFSDHNKKTGHRTLAYDFSTVDYSEGVFEAVTGPPKHAKAPKNENDTSALKGAGRVEYSWEEDGKRVGVDGVVRVRKGVEDGAWVFVDLRHSAYSKQGVMCCACTERAGHPVHHGSQTCPLEETLPLSEEDFVQPNIDRLEGVQVSRKPAKPRSKGAVPVGSSNLTCEVIKQFLKDHNLPVTGRREELLERARSVDGSATNCVGDRDKEGSGDTSGHESEDKTSERDWEGDTSDEDGEDSESDERSGNVVEAVTKRKHGDPEPFYFFKWGSGRGTWETSSSWLDRSGLDLMNGLSREDVEAELAALDASAVCNVAVDDVIGRRVVKGGRGGPEVQYRFAWLGEEKTTWETRLGWAGRWGELQFREGKTKEYVLARFEELDSKADALPHKKKKKTR